METSSISLHINLESVKPGWSVEAVSGRDLHANSRDMGARVLLVELPFGSFTISRVVQKCREALRSAGFSLAPPLAWHHGYVANTLIVSLG